jgi:transcriptional regulator with XRE-family HTH domain
MPTKRPTKFFKKPLNEWVFNDMILEERQINNFSQEEMGKLLGVSNRAISGYEQRRIKPSLDTVIKFMNVFSKKIRIIDKFDDAEDYVL